MQEFLQAGVVLNTHGVRGMIKVEPWCDSPDFLKGFSTVYMDATPYSVQRAAVSKGKVLLQLEGITTYEAAQGLKEKIISIRRQDASLPPGRHFLVDLVGLEVREEGTNRVLGKLCDIMTLPAGNVYVVQNEGGREILIPAVEEFIRHTDLAGGYMLVHLLPGMEE